MVRHCDFVEQSSLPGDESTLRPDLIISMPGGKHVVVDAKAPLQAVLDAYQARDEAEREAHLRDHARLLRKHVKQLADKAYWSRLDSSPDFVVMFLPGEHLYGAALEADPALMEDAMAQRVVIATPTTLLALLHSVGYGWQQERVAESAQAVSELGRELHARLVKLSTLLSTLGTRLNGAVRAYNEAIGSYEARVLPAAQAIRGPRRGGGVRRAGRARAGRAVGAAGAARRIAAGARWLGVGQRRSRGPAAARGRVNALVRPRTRAGRSSRRRRRRAAARRPNAPRPAATARQPPVEQVGALMRERVGGRLVRADPLQRGRDVDVVEHGDRARRRPRPSAASRRGSARSCAHTRPSSRRRPDRFVEPVARQMAEIDDAQPGLLDPVVVRAPARPRRAAPSWYSASWARLSTR